MTKDFVRDIVAKGYAQRVLERSKNSDSKGKTWLISHRGIYHPHKPGKILVVFHYSSRLKGVSLADVLIRGPDLTNSFLRILTRFRQEHMAVMADNQPMFHELKFLNVTIYFFASYGGQTAIYHAH